MAPQPRARCEEWLRAKLARRELIGCASRLPLESVRHGPEEGEDARVRVRAGARQSRALDADRAGVLVIERAQRLDHRDRQAAVDPSSAERACRAPTRAVQAGSQAMADGALAALYVRCRCSSPADGQFRVLVLHAGERAIVAASASLICQWEVLLIHIVMLGVSSAVLYAAFYYLPVRRRRSQI